MSPTEMMSRIKQSLALLESVRDDLGTTKEFVKSTLRTRLERAIDRIESVMVAAETLVGHESPRKALRCTYEGRFDIYICQDMNCPVHGYRNRILDS